MERGEPQCDLSTVAPAHHVGVLDAKLCEQGRRVLGHVFIRKSSTLNVRRVAVAHLLDGNHLVIFRQQIDLPREGILDGGGAPVQQHDRLPFAANLVKELHAVADRCHLGVRR